MTSPFGVRRKARVVGQDDEPSDTPMTDVENKDPEPLFKRPSSKTRKRPSMRLSFGPGGTSMNEDDRPSEVFTPKKQSLSRQAAERNALRKSASLVSLKQSESSLHREAPVEDRPSYSKENLAELKSSTPSTPRTQRSESPKAQRSPKTALDITAKFGTDLTRYERVGGTHIPTEVEIAEKKARRARLAKERKYKTEASSGSEDDNHYFPNDPRDRDSDEDEFRSHRDMISLSEKPSKHPTSTARLAADDDEDLLDDSIHYGTPGRIHIGRAAEQERVAQERAQRADQIDEAQLSDSGSTSGEEEGERERRTAYDDAQTRAGMAGLHLDPLEQRRRDDKDSIRTPPRTTPLPTLSSIAEKLSSRTQELESSIAKRVRDLEEAEMERQEIKEQEKAIQTLLNEVVERWKAFNNSEGDIDANLENTETEERPLLGAGLGSRLATNGDERGLESIGGTPVRGQTPLNDINGTI